MSMMTKNIEGQIDFFGFIDSQFELYGCPRTEEEKAEWFAKNEGAVFSVAHSFDSLYIPGMDFDDKAQVVRVAILKAMESFNPMACNKFITFAMEVAKNAVLQEARTMNALKRGSGEKNHVSFDAPVGGEEDARTYAEVIAETSTNPRCVEDEAVDNAETAELLHIAEMLLDDETLYFVKAIIMGDTVQNLAKETGKTKSYISQVLAGGYSTIKYYTDNN